MITQFKIFEYYSKTGNQLDYEVGDTVIFIAKNHRITDLMLKMNKKYKVVKIYSIPEDKFLKNPFLRVDVEDLETGEVYKGFKSTDFKLDVEFDADKYNL